MPEETEQFKYCVHCAAKIPTASKFCSKCGKSQTALEPNQRINAPKTVVSLDERKSNTSIRRIVCSNCGKETYASSKGCSHCGSTQDIEHTLKYSDYAEVPFHRKNWFAVTSCLFFPPVTLGILLSGDVYKMSKGQLDTYGIKGKVALILFGGFGFAGIFILATILARLLGA